MKISMKSTTTKGTNPDWEEFSGNPAPKYACMVNVPKQTPLLTSNVQIVNKMSLKWQSNFMSNDPTIINKLLWPLMSTTLCLRYKTKKQLGFKLWLVEDLLVNWPLFLSCGLSWSLDSLKWATLTSIIDNDWIFVHVHHPNALHSRCTCMK